MRIAHITDLHIADGLSNHFEIDSIKNFENIISDIKNKNVDCIICTGDCGSFYGLQIIKSKIRSNNEKIIYSLGNHDNLEEFIDVGLIEKNYERNKKIIFNDFVIILFDTSNGVLSKNQYDWLVENIEQNKQNLVFTHFPLLNTSTNQIDLEIGLKNKEIFEEFFNQEPNQIHIFCGHYHKTDIISHNQIVQYICPSGLMQIKEENREIKTDSFNYGYNIIEIVKKKINIDTIFFNGFGKDNPWK